MIIAISGAHGSGKSEIGKRLAENLTLTYYSTGNAFRQLAKDRKMTLEEFTKHVENHPEIDKELDNLIINVAKKGNAVIESQLSGYLLKDIADFKILLKCPLDIRVKRIAERDKNTDNNKKLKDENYYNEKFRETRIREDSEHERFKILYNIDLNDQKRLKEIFDLIIDTEHLSIEQVLNKILTKIKKKK